MEKLKAILHLIVYGDDNRKYPETYFEEQSYQCARLLPLVSLIFAFIWLGYIPLDAELYPDIIAIRYLRIGLSIISLIIFGLYWVPFFRKNSIHLITILGGYAAVSTAIITGLTKGDPSYMGGFCMVVVASLFVPLRTTIYYAVMIFALICFFTTLVILEVDILNDISKYSLNDLLSAIVVAFLLVFLLDRDRRSYYNKSKDRERQRIQIQGQAITIKERNKKLEHQKIEIEDAYKELQTTQRQLIQSEKLASLGQLVASIAHEINTPLGAIRSSADSIEEILLDTLPNFAQFIKKLDNQTLFIFDEMIQVATQKIDTLTSRQKRTLKYKLIDQLEKSAISDAEEFADLIVSMNLQEENKIFMTLLQLNQPKQLIKDVLQTAYQLTTIIKSNQTIKEATNRAAKTVFALKNFSRQENTEAKSEVKINETLETTLVLYHNKIKQGIEVVCHLEEIPVFWGYPNELMQVWTNLIHNAIQAMHNKGKLTITSQLKNKKVLISIKDTGDGIPKEIQERIFEAFFTTKIAGEGSGLGLDITQKIIAKHNGSIWFETQKYEGTTFFVEIPTN